MSSAPFKEGQRVKLSGADGIDKAKGLKDGDIGTVSADGHNIVEVVWDSLKPERAIMADHQIEVLEEELSQCEAAVETLRTEVHRRKSRLQSLRLNHKDCDLRYGDCELGHPKHSTHS